MRAVLVIELEIDDELGSLQQAVQAVQAEVPGSIDLHVDGTTAVHVAIWESADEVMAVFQDVPAAETHE